MGARPVPFPSDPGGPSSVRQAEALGNDGIDDRIECHSNVSTGHFEIIVRIPGDAVAPIDNSVVLGVDGGLHHRGGYRAAEGINEVASTGPGVALGKNGLAVFLQNSQPDRFRSLDHSAIGNRSPNRGCERDYRRDIAGSLPSDGTRNDSSQAVADEVDL